MEVPFEQPHHLAACRTLFELANLLPANVLVSVVEVSKATNAKLFFGNFDQVMEKFNTDYLYPHYLTNRGTSDFPFQDMIKILEAGIKDLKEKNLDSKFINPCM